MEDKIEVLIDGIPREDYGKPTSQTVYSNNYNEEIDQMKYIVEE